MDDGSVNLICNLVCLCLFESVLVTYISMSLDILHFLKEMFSEILKISICVLALVLFLILLFMPFSILTEVSYFLSCI